MTGTTFARAGVVEEYNDYTPSLSALIILLNPLDNDVLELQSALGVLRTTFWAVDLDDLDSEYLGPQRGDRDYRTCRPLVPRSRR